MTAKRKRPKKAPYRYRFLVSVGQLVDGVCGICTLGVFIPGAALAVARWTIGRIHGRA